MKLTTSCSLAPGGLRRPGKFTVSEMLESMLRVAAAPPLDRSELPPLTRRALGMSSPMTDGEVRQVIEEEIARKHG